MGLLASDELLLVTSGLLWGDRWPLNSVSMTVWYGFSCLSHGDFGVLVGFSLLGPTGASKRHFLQELKGAYPKFESQGPGI